MLQIDKALFHKNLLLTQQYCALQLANTEKNNASILRSINPDFGGGPAFNFKLVNHYFIPVDKYQFSMEWTVEPLTDYPKVFLKLFEMQLEIKEGLNLEHIDEYEGEILVVEIVDTVVDGASESESEGFVDGYDLPPIDTWFYKVEEDNGILLFAWIPKQFQWLIDEAIAVNVVDMLQWFRKSLPDDYRYIMGHKY